MMKTMHTGTHKHKNNMKAKNKNLAMLFEITFDGFHVSRLPSRSFTDSSDASTPSSTTHP